MTKEAAFVAIDLGAESGRVVLGTLEDGRVAMEEMSRFPNYSVALPDGLHWNILELYRQSVCGLLLAAQRSRVIGVGIDTWGVDYGLLDEQGRLLGLPFHYRDPRTQDMPGRAATHCSESRAYQITGIRPMPINTVYQLLAEEGSAALCSARHLLLIPDLLAYWLSGVMASERTAASTTGLLEAQSGAWARDLICSYGLPESVFGRLVEPGTILGPLRPGVVDGSAAAGCPRAPAGLAEAVVIASAGHDTAAAFAAVPAQDSKVAVLSSGTWSLLGVELQAPVLTEAARAAELSNERGVFGTVRLLRNIMGLWLVQGCRAAWERSGSPISYEELMQWAAEAGDDCPLFDPDDPSLAYPAGMPAEIDRLIKESGQRSPDSKGQLIRSILLSLSCKYRLVLEELEHVTGHSIAGLHVVGGGSRNRLLCQLTADITGREVFAGPAEASSLGNVLVQAHAFGLVSCREEMREVARASVTVDRYVPSTSAVFKDEIYDRFLEVTRLVPPGAFQERKGREQ